MEKSYKLEIADRAVDDYNDWMGCWCYWKTIAEYDTEEKARAALDLIVNYDSEVNGVKSGTRSYRIVASIEEEIISTRDEANKQFADRNW